MQQRLAWKEMEQEKKERKQQKKAFMSSSPKKQYSKPRPKSFPHSPKTASPNGTDDSTRRHSAAPTISQKNTKQSENKAEKVSYIS